MVMNPTEESIGALLQNKLKPEIYSFKILHSYLSFLDHLADIIHIKLDSGLHRLRFEERDVDELIATLKQNKKIKVASIFSHLAGADEAEHDAFSEEQVKSFQQAAEKISAALEYKPLYHILNSPGILR